MKAIRMFQYFLRVSFSLQTGDPSQQHGVNFSITSLGPQAVTHSKVLHCSLQRLHPFQGPGDLRQGCSSHGAQVATFGCPAQAQPWKTYGPLIQAPYLFQKIQHFCLPQKSNHAEPTASLTPGLARRIFEAGSLTSTSRKRKLGFLSTEGIEKRLGSFPNVHAGKAGLLQPSSLNPGAQFRSWDTHFLLMHKPMKFHKILKWGLYGVVYFPK